MKNLFPLGFHPFHMVELSPWPLISSLSIFSLVVNSYHFMNGSGPMGAMLLGIFSTSLVSSLWWRDVIRESTFMGKHTKEVQTGLMIGVLMFIASEVMFFFSFFFGYFFSALSPDVQIGCCWPPSGIQPLSYKMVPLLNTLILLSSGVSITWSHHGLVSSDGVNAILGLLMTIFLGSIFSFFQYEEYYSCSFTLADGVYGSFFFLMTGFHGIHVLIGVIFLSVSMCRLLNFHFSNSHHFGFESSTWYWHFVDVVWLFLYVSVYWWGS